MAQNRIIRLPEVKRRVGLSRSSIYEYIQKGLFPKQIGIGARAVGWLETDIDLWIDGHRGGGGR
jgi:prophage regulatory protein